MSRVSSMLRQVRAESYAKAAASNPFNKVSPPVVPAAVEVPARPQVDLSWNQQVALLRLAPHGEAAHAVYWKLKEQTELPALCASDCHALAGMGFAFRAQTERFHRLTDLGRLTANDVAREIAAARGIHAFYAHNGNRYSSTVRCVCGWATVYSRSNSAMSMDRIRAQGAHLRTVEQMQQLAATLSPAPSQTTL